jgi:hypothetical protein
VAVWKITKQRPDWPFQAIADGLFLFVLLPSSFFLLNQ